MLLLSVRALFRSPFCVDHYVSLLEGWMTVMYATTDIDHDWVAGAAPVAGDARRNAFFFVSFIVIGCFVVLNELYTRLAAIFNLKIN